MEQKNQTDSYLDNLVGKIKSVLLANPGKTIPQGSESSKYPKAAVAMLLHPDKQGSELLTLMVRRKTRETDPWSGQMAFPGGRYSETDRDLLATVIREVIEEIGVDLRKTSILGSLDEVIGGSFPITVRPYVALTEEGKMEIMVDHREIESCVWIPLSFFQDRRNIQPLKIDRRGQTLQFPSYKYLGNEIIWGMTLRIIEDFLRKIGP
jgi:8-oxo-dGTP pyrophosphatase MutT (NUDIX family)